VDVGVKPPLLLHHHLLRNMVRKLGIRLEVVMLLLKVGFGNCREEGEVEEGADIGCGGLDFTKCLEATNGDMGSCGYYLEALSEWWMVVRIVRFG
jgi:hypothetical protein